VRRLRIVCAVTVLGLAGFAAALKSPAAARAQSKTSALPSSSQASPTRAASNAAQSTASAAQTGPSAPMTIATNVSARSLAVQPQSPSATNAANSQNSTASESAPLFLTNADKGNRIFTLAPAVNSSGATNNLSAAVSPASKIALFAGQAAPGSLGDGGAASAAEFDLKLDSLAMRSGIAVALDGTVFVADTLNATIRSIAGPASSEPGIVRSVAGRFGPQQNVELVEPLGLALDRAGNLYIADRGANAVLMLHAATSAAPGALEILAHVVAPASVGVTLDGSKVFAASPDTGSIVEINATTRSISTAAISPSQLFVANQQGTGGRIIPTGLAVDGAGNVFVSFSGPGGGLDQIWRLDATSGKTTSAARGLTSPGEIAFDSNGNLFIADQGTRRLLELRGAGVPANGVSLTPPVGPVPTDFGLEPVDGTTPSQSFTLTNNSGASITQISSSIQSGATNFKVANTSCTSTLLNLASCVINVAFTPQSSGALSDNLAVTFTAGANPATLTTAVTGTGDDYQIMLASGALQQITVDPGVAATFLLQVVPDDTFSGPVVLLCPATLPTSTTCGISAGTTVTTPLVSSLMVTIAAGTPVPFNVTFQTTAPGTPVPSAIGFRPSLQTPRGRSIGRSASVSNFAKLPAASAFAVFGILATILCAVFAPGIFRRHLATPIAIRASLANLCGNSINGARLARLIYVCALFIICSAALSSCGGGSGIPTIPRTPAGTTNLTIQGTAQGATRGFVVTLVVNK
jgi:centrosomal CEP192-like protein